MLAIFSQSHILPLILVKLHQDNQTYHLQLLKWHKKLQNWKSYERQETVTFSGFHTVKANKSIEHTFGVKSIKQYYDGFRIVGHKNIVMKKLLEEK